MQRWEREAEALAALNDDRICPGPATGAGEPLDARLARGPLPPEDFYAIALAVTSTLEAPHRLGILHRHLSTANVWLRPNGSIQLLHFGSAHARAAAAGAASSIEIPLSNEPDDPRADLFELGSVLAAMAQPKPSRALRSVIHRCHKKNPDQRFQSAHALREALERLQSRASAGSRPRGVPWRVISFTGIALLIGVLTIRKLAMMPSGPLPIPDLNFTQLTYTADVAAVAIAPDARYAALVRRSPAGQFLNVLSLATGRERRLVAPGAHCCSDPSVAPGDATVYFRAGNRLESVPLTGGPAQTIASQAGSGAAVAASGAEIAFIAHHHLVVASANGATARVLAPGPFDAVTPAWSPDGEHLAVAGAKTLDVITTVSGASTSIAPGVFATISGIAWLPSGRGLLVTAATAPRLPQQIWQMAWPGGGQLTALTGSDEGFAQLTLTSGGRLATLRPSPEASLWVQPTAHGAFTQLPIGGLTRDGMHGVAWLPGGSILTTHVFHHDHQLWIMSPDGKQAGPIAVKGVPGALLSPVVTRKGQILLLARESGKARLWRINSDGSGATALAPPSSDWAGLGLMREATQIEFLCGQHLCSVPVAGGPVRLLMNQPVADTTNAASPDGTYILVFAPNPQLLTLTPAGKMISEPLALDPSVMLPPYAFTPDGRAITYITRQPAADNIWALPLDGRASHPLTHFTSQQIFAYAFSSDGRLVVSRGSTNSNAILTNAIIRR